MASNTQKHLKKFESYSEPRSPQTELSIWFFHTQICNEVVKVFYMLFPEGFWCSERAGYCPERTNFPHTGGWGIYKTQPNGARDVRLRKEMVGSLEHFVQLLLVPLQTSIVCHLVTFNNGNAGPMEQCICLLAESPWFNLSRENVQCLIAWWWPGEMLPRGADNTDLPGFTMAWFT